MADDGYGIILKAVEGGNQRIEDALGGLSQSLSQQSREMAKLTAVLTATQVKTGGSNGVAYALLTMIGALAAILFLAVGMTNSTIDAHRGDHQEAMRAEKADRIAADSANEISSVRRHQTIVRMSKERHDEGVAAALQRHNTAAAAITAADKELRLQINRIEDYFDTATRSRMNGPMRPPPLRRAPRAH